MTKILKTTDYNIFKLIKTNRMIDDAHVERLAKSIEEVNLLHANPIIVNTKNEVLDGQHRLEACKQLEIEVHYVVIDDNNKNNTIIKLNSISKVWVVEDYLQHYVNMNIKEYKEIKKLHQKYPIPLATLVRLFGAGRSSTTDFRTGNYKLKIGVHDYYDMLEALMELKDYIPFFTRSCFVSAFAKIYLNRNYDHQVMLERMEKASHKFRMYATVAENLRGLEDIYNHGQTNRVRFF